MLPRKERGAGHGAPEPSGRSGAHATVSRNHRGVAGRWPGAGHGAPSNVAATPGHCPNAAGHPGATVPLKHRALPREHWPRRTVRAPQARHPVADSGDGLRERQCGGDRGARDCYPHSHLGRPSGLPPPAGGWASGWARGAL
jgi:hypothetical protein